MEGSRFESTAPALPFHAETSCFEMILTEMSDLYEFCKSITVFTNLMWKSWLLVTKLDACVAFGYHLCHEQLIRVNKSTNCLSTHDWNTGNEFENRIKFVIFKPWKVRWNGIAYCRNVYRYVVWFDETWNLMLCKWGKTYS